MRLLLPLSSVSTTNATTPFFNSIDFPSKFLKSPNPNFNFFASSSHPTQHSWRARRTKKTVSAHLLNLLFKWISSSGSLFHCWNSENFVQNFMFFFFFLGNWSVCPLVELIDLGMNKLFWVIVMLLKCWIICCWIACSSQRAPTCSRIAFGMTKLFWVFVMFV